MHPSSPRRQRGITLIEALIAFLVLALGMLAVARIQTHLRANAELARQRSEAVRLAQEEIESLRAFAVIAAAPGVPSFDAVASDSRTVDASSGHASNTAYLVTRQVDAAGALQAKNLRVTVSWIDRAGAAQQIVLASVIAGTAPAFAGALGLARGSATAKGPFSRSVRIPLNAKDFGDGRSAFKPVGGGTLAFLFDNASGLLTGRCAGVAPATSTDQLTSANLGACNTNIGHLLSGIVRFSSATPPDAAQGNDAPLAFTVAMAMTGSYPVAPSCSVEPIVAPGGDRFVAYHCAVYPSAGGAWSGRANLVPIGWTIGTKAADKRVCRATSDLDASGSVDTNIEHPAHYAGVTGNLAHQNFLIVGGTVACPSGHAAQVAGNNGDVYVDLGTAQHQP